MQTLKLTKKYETYPEYKDSGVEWLGRIPKDWKLDNIQHLFTKIKRLGHENEELLSVYRDRGVIIKSSRDDNHNQASEDLSTYQLVEIGDLAINKMKAWQGSVAISNYRGIVSPAYFISRSLSKNNSQFLHHLLRSDIYIKQYERNSGGVRNDQWDLDYDRFRKLEVPLPDIDAQSNISKHLDSKIDIIEKIIENKNKLKELLFEKQTAIISSVVTNGLDRNTEFVNSSISWVGNIPKHWLVKKGKFLFQHKKEVNSNYQCQHVLALTLGGVMNKEDYGSFSLVPKDYSGYQIFYPNDLVFKLIDLENRQTSRVGIVPVKGIMSPAYIRISPKHGVDSSYYYWLYYSYYLNGVFNFLGMGVRSTLNQYDLLSQFIVMPPESEQHDIAQYLSKKTQEVEITMNTIEKSIAVLKEYRTALISNVVTGKIKV